MLVNPVPALADAAGIRSLKVRTATTVVRMGVRSVFMAGYSRGAGVGLGCKAGRRKMVSAGRKRLFAVSSSSGIIELGPAAKRLSVRNPIQTSRRNYVPRGKPPIRVIRSIYQSLIEININLMLFRRQRPSISVHLGLKKNLQKFCVFSPSRFFSLVEM